MNRVGWVVVLGELFPDDSQRFHSFIVSATSFAWSSYVNHVIFAEYGSELVAIARVDAKVSNFVVDGRHTSSAPNDDIVLKIACSQEFVEIGTLEERDHSLVAS